MISFSEFDGQFQLVSQQVERIAWNQEGHPTQLDPNLSADVHITLKTGDSYRITIDTPDHVNKHMEQGNYKSHFEEGLILVKDVSFDSMLDAIERLLGDNYYGLPFYGLPIK